MANEPAHLLAKHLRTLTTTARIDALTDRELIERFAAVRDEDAFTALVRRHGPMVLRVCRRILHNSYDADDVFQATFLVLSRKAASLRCRDSVGCFLHGVAYRLALKARTQFAQRRMHESRAAVEKQADDPLAELSVREAQAILDEELLRLPEKYRTVLVLCCLEGRTRDEAARQLNWPAKLVKSRLEQGRERLRSRLCRRGLALPAALGATLLMEEAAPAALPAMLIRATLQAARASNSVSTSVALLAESALGDTAIGKAKTVVVGLLLLTGALAAGMGAFAPPQPEEKPAAVKAPGTSQAEGQRPARTDRYGDPLPSGALARLGTKRWRHGDQVTAVAFSPDGSLLASGSWDNSLHLWDAKTGKLLRILLQGQHPGMIVSIFFTPDGKRLVSCGGHASDKSARVWDLSTGKELRRWPIPGGWKLALSPDGKLLAGWGNGRPNQNAISLWDIATGKQVRELPFEGVQDFVSDLAFSPDGKRLVSGGVSILRLFDVVNGRQLRTFGEGERINSIAFSSDGKTVAVARFKAPITLWDVTTGARLREFDIDAGSRVAFTHDGKILAGCKPESAKIILWDVATAKKLRELPGQHFQVWDLAFSPDDKTLAVGNLDSQIRLWDISTSLEISTAMGHRGCVRGLAFIDHDQGIFSTSDEGLACHWDVATSKVLRKHQEEWGAFGFFSDLSPDGRTLPLFNDADIHLLELSTGKKLRVFKGHKRHVRHAIFSPKGDMLASSAGEDPHILLWDVASGKQLRSILTRYVQVNGEYLRNMVWSPDGKILASVGTALDDPRGITVILLDPTTGKQLRAWPLRRNKDRMQTSASVAVIFSPDGTLLAAVDGDNTIVIWEAATGKMRARLPGHRSTVTALVFSPDGLMLASGGADRTIQLWELSTWKERRAYEGHLGWITKLAFSADGLILASGSSDTSVLLWAVMDRDPRRRQPDLALSQQQLQNLWDDLASEDASRAWRAVYVLVQAPKQAIPWLKEHLKPLSAADREKIGHLMAELDSDEFAVRQQAVRELEKLGEQAESALRNALKKGPSLEVRRRVEQMLEKLQGPVQAAGVMRELRSLEVLEHIGTAEARAALRTLAGGPPEARLTRQARAALARLMHKSSTAR